MKFLTDPIELLTFEEMQLIHDKSLELLASPGLYIDHDGTLDALEEAGATVGRSERIVRMPGELVEDAVRAAATWPGLHNDNEKEVRAAETLRLQTLLEKPLEFAFGGSGLEMVGENGHGSRPATYDDLERTIRFGNGHPRIRSIGGPPVLVTHDAVGREIPAVLRSIAGMAYMAKHSQKFGWNGIECAADVAFAARLGELLASTEEAYRKSPFLLCCRCSISPLQIGRSSAETLFELAKRSLPVTLAPMPIAGGTSPVTPASAILISNAEFLGFVAAMHTVGSDSPRSGLIISAALDMQTTIASFSSPGVTLQDAGIVQLLSRFYGVPCESFSDYIDAKYPGYQSGSERALKIAALAACGQICPSVGQLRSGLVCSPIQACLDIEAFDWFHRFLRGIEVNEETLCTKLIQNRGVGGSFLDSDHTLDHYREELYFPQYSDRSLEEERDMVEAASEEVRTILQSTPVYSREPALCREIDRLYEVEVAKRIGGDT